MLNKFLSFVGLLILGYVLLRYSKWIIDHTGMRSATAERVLGTGGTYTALKLLGVLAIVFAFYYTFGMK